MKTIYLSINKRELSNAKFATMQRLPDFCYWKNTEVSVINTEDEVFLLNSWQTTQVE